MTPCRSLTILVCLLTFGGCADDSNEPSTADKALKELQSKYDELTQEDLDTPVQWAAEDFENIGDWEYKVLEVPYTSSAQLEEVFDELGNDRWEVFWIERNASGFIVMLKKPAISYISKIPFSQIGRFVIGDPDTAE